MIRSILTLSVACLFVLPVSRSDKSRYLPTGNEAAIVGTVTVAGQTVEERKIDMSADPACTSMRPKAWTESVVRNSDKLKNVLVYVKSGEPLTQYTFDEPSMPATLQHRECSYLPRVMGIRVNQKLMIENQDPTAHNTHPTPKVNGEWNQSQAAYGPPFMKTFALAEPAIIFRCNQHPWERAFVGVFDHPFFATSNEFGSFEIQGIPAGAYKIVAWHETLGQQEFEVSLAPSEVKNLSLAFAGNRK